MNAGLQKRSFSLAATLAAVLLAAITGLGMAGCAGSSAASSGGAASSEASSSASSESPADSSSASPDGASSEASGSSVEADTDAEADDLQSEGDAYVDSEYTMRFNDYGYSDAFYMPGDPLTLKASLVTYDEALEDAVDVDATFEWDVDPKLGAQVEGDTMTVRSMPEVGSYPMSVTARDKNGKELLVEKHVIEVKDAPEPSLVVQLEENATKVDTCKTDDYLAILLKNCPWEWISAEGYRLDWQVKDLNSGKVYDDSTNLTDLDAKHNGGIEAESFGNYKWPAMMAIFGTPSDYEITATLVTAAGKEISSSATLHVK